VDADEGPVARVVARDAADHVVCLEVVVSSCQCSRRKQGGGGRRTRRSARRVRCSKASCNNWVSVAIAPEEDTPSFTIPNIGIRSSYSAAR
jgi:hypothetical protein